MKKETLYIDLTILIAYFDKRAQWQMEETQKWWHNELPKYQVFIAPNLADDISDVYDGKKRKKLHKLISNFLECHSSPEIGQIARGYLEQEIFPQNAARVAYYLAIASFHKIDFLVTWDNTWLAEGHQRKRIRLFNTSAGIYVPEIVTPSELMSQELI
ncbi:MAG: hypothetical protein ABFS56_32590 [Pseudomonadota bacterium]